ncbi:MAG: DUF4143 domain-containing protein, partial [Proteobacteria bacterium]|nr:DUF4143 domain-containing protein [Pseudomonadota bacterium]
ENILSEMPRWQASFYRTSNGAEIDLVLTKGTKKIAVEVKSSTSPKLSKGFWTSMEQVSPDEAIIVAPVSDQYPLAENVTVKPLSGFLEQYS